MTPMLPAAPEPGTVVTAERVPRRMFRRRPMRVTGAVTRVGAHSLTIRNAGGYYTVDPASAVRA